MHNVFTVAEVAAMLRATPAAVRQRLRNGTLGGFRIGTDWRIPKADLDAFIEQNRNGYRPPIPPQDDDADLIAEAEAEFESVFGRSYGGMVDSYRTEDAEAILVSLGSVTGTARVVCDYIAGMTDRFALSRHAEIFGRTPQDLRNV